MVTKLAVALSLFAGCSGMGGLGFHPGGGGPSTPSVGTPSSASSSAEPANTETPASDGTAAGGKWGASRNAKYRALLEKLDDPMAAENFEYVDAVTRWKLYDKGLAEPWVSFKTKFGLSDGATASIDAESFEADWYENLRKNSHAGLTDPYTRCDLGLTAREITRNVTDVLVGSKQCMEALKAIKAFRCVNAPKQTDIARFELLKDGTLVFHIHDPMESDSSHDFSSVLEQYGNTFAQCASVVQKGLGR